MPSKGSRRAVRAYQRGPHLKRRGKVWYACGKPFPKDGVSLHTSDRAEAERRFRDQLRADVRPGGGVEAAPREVPLVDAVDQWLAAPHGYTARSLQSLRNRVLAWGLWCATEGVKYASEVTPELVDKWVHARSAEVSRGTVNRDLRAAKVALRWCAERSLTARCGAILDRKELREAVKHKRHVVPDPGELTRILRAVTHLRYRSCLEGLVASGLRIEELRKLHAGSLLGSEKEGWRLSVRPEDGAAATAWQTKGYREREIPLAAPSAAAVKRYLAVAIGPRGKPPSESKLLQVLHAACDTAKVPHCGLHDLRRAFATEASRAGVPLSVIATWLGHADVRTTERYIASYRSDRSIVAPVARALRTPLAPPAKVLPMPRRKKAAR